MPGNASRQNYYGLSLPIGLSDFGKFVTLCRLAQVFGPVTPITSVWGQSFVGFSRPKHNIPNALFAA